MSQFTRPFRVILVDADANVIDMWDLRTLDECKGLEEPFVDSDGTMHPSDAQCLGEEIRCEVNKAVKS